MITLDEREARLARIGVQSWVGELERVLLICGSLMTEDGAQSCQKAIDECYLLLIKLDKVLQT